MGLVHSTARTRLFIHRAVDCSSTRSLLNLREWAVDHAIDRLASPTLCCAGRSTVRSIEWHPPFSVKSQKVEWSTDIAKSAHICMLVGRAVDHSDALLVFLIFEHQFILSPTRVKKLYHLDFWSSLYKVRWGTWCWILGLKAKETLHACTELAYNWSTCIFI